MQQMRNEQPSGREVDVARIFRMLWKRAWVIVAAAVVFGIIFWAVSVFAITPTYRTSFSAYIGNRQMTEENISTSTSDLSASKGLMYVYREIVMSRTVLIQAAMKCELYDQGYSLVADMIKTYVSEDAPVLTVYVETEDPVLTKRLADAIAEIAPEQVSAVVAGSTMTLIDPPYTPSKPYSPNVAGNVVYGMIMGVILSVIALVLFDLFYDNVLEGDDLEARYQIPVIGHVPNLQYAQKNDVRYGQTKERNGGK